MKSQRYGIKRSLQNEPVLIRDDNGTLMNVSDAEADKAEATAELRAELVAALDVAFTLTSNAWLDGVRTAGASQEARAMGDRLVELGAWESERDSKRGVTYRPVEPQDSGESDETPTSD